MVALPAHARRRRLHARLRGDGRGRPGHSEAALLPRNAGRLRRHRAPGGSAGRVRGNGRRPPRRRPRPRPAAAAHWRRLVRQPGQHRSRVRPSPAGRRLPLRRLGVVRDRWADLGGVPPGAVRPRRARPRHSRERDAARRGSLRPLPTFVTAMRLYNSQLSGNCWKARQILALRGIEYERVEIDVFDRSNRPELLGGKNPALRVPTLEFDDGQFLAESNAILWFFGDGSPYVPSDPLERARVLQWMFFEQYEVEPSIAVARFWIALLGERDRYATELESKWRAGNRALAALDGHLDGREWLVGDAF